MDNYNNIINQQYGNIVYSNNMMQTNMPMQQNTSENIQHIPNDTRLPPNLMEPRGMQMVSEAPSLTSDSMRIADNSIDRVQNTFAQSGYNTNYVANMSTNENDMHNINISEPKINETGMTNVHPHLMQDDKYKQHSSEHIEPILTQPIEAKANPEISEPSATDDFKLDEDKETDKVDTVEENLNVEESKNIDDVDKTKSDATDDNTAAKPNLDEDIDVDKKNDVEDSKDEDKVDKSEEIKGNDAPSESAVVDEVKKDAPVDVVTETKAAEEDYSTTCRVCMKTGLANLTDMCNQDGVLKILDKIMLCASVQIAKNDGLPCHICNSCIDKLHVAYDFKITCESSDVELRKRLNIAVPKTVVKTEFVLIECDDQDYDLDVSEQEKPGAKRRYKEESDIDFQSDSQEDSGSDSSYAVNKPKSKRKSKRRTRSASKRQMPKRDRRTKEWRDSVAPPSPEASRKRTKYVVDPDDDKPLITIKKVKPEKEEKATKHACTICNKTFPYLSFLKQHMLTHQDKDPVIKCKYCTAKFTKQEEYKQHTLDYHAEDMDEDYPILPRKSYKKANKSDSGGEEEKERERERTPRERNKHHKCPYCDVVCTSAMKLKTHKRTHVGEKPFVCHICQKPFKQTVSLESHIRRHEEDKSLQCDHCQKICASKSELNRHIKTDHSDVKHFECAICNKEFPTKLKLDKHVLKHEKEDEEFSQTSKESKEKKVPSTKDLFKSIAPITSTYWSDSYSD